jgi:hypothetical protein
MGIVRKVGVGILAALVAGVALGLLARLLMRLATLAAGQDGEFSLGGTAGIVVLFVAFTLPGAVLAALVTRRGRSVLLAAGAVALAAAALGIAATDLAGIGSLAPLQWVGVGTATACVFLCVLALPVLTLWVEHRAGLGPRAAARPVAAPSPGPSGAGPSGAGPSAGGPVAHPGH